MPVKIVVFGPERRVGAWRGEHIVDLNLALHRLLAERGEANPEASAAHRVPADLASLIARGPAGLEAAETALQAVADTGFQGAWAGRRLAWPAVEVPLHAPWAGRRIACAGGNFAAHLAGMAAQAGRPARADLDQVAAEARQEAQWGFWKVPHAVAGPGEAVPYPKRTRYLDYEGEVAVVIGAGGKDLAARDIGRYVWGVTLLNDLSIRDAAGGGRGISYNLAKNFDGSTAMGPCIVVGELDPQDVEVQTHVNGQVRQGYTTREMIWSFGEILAHLSRDFTFVPGDVVAGGTSVGTAADQSPRGPDGVRARDLFLRPGDEVEVSSPAIGRLLTRIAAP